MPKLTTLKPRISTVDTTRARLIAQAQPKRTRGRKLQTRRFRIWKADPHCAHCRRLVAFPEGFQLDHEVPLHLGGEDTDSNLQVLCVQADGSGCHQKKTADEARQRSGLRGGICEV
jgi:5-methylcytosine-specific restriction protein A